MLCIACKGLNLGIETVVQVILYLSGLTCNHENFITKAGAQRCAAELGIALVAPDTSPRGLGIEGEDESWDFGTGKPPPTKLLLNDHIVDTLRSEAALQCCCDGLCSSTRTGRRR